MGGVVFWITAVINFLWVSAFCAKSVFLFAAEVSQAFIGVFLTYYVMLELVVAQMDAS